MTFPKLELSGLIQSRARLGLHSGVQFLWGAGILLCQNTRPALDPNHPPTQYAFGLLCQGQKQLEHEIDLSLPFNAQVKNVGCLNTWIGVVSLGNLCTKYVTALVLVQLSSNLLLYLCMMSHFLLY